MRDWPRRSSSVRVLFAILNSYLLILPSLVPLREASAFPTHPGKWTGYVAWQGTAVNLSLLPGGSSPYHSRIIYWAHDDDLPVQGGYWGWTPPNDALVNAGNYPVASFDSLGLDDPPTYKYGNVTTDIPINIFCSGQTMLSEGGLLVTGGTSLGEVGIRQALIFNPDADANGNWVRVDSMDARRWYSSNCLLPDSRVLVVTGSSYAHFVSVGGIYNGSPDAATNQLQRFGVAKASAWEPSVVPIRDEAPFDQLAPLSDAATTDNICCNQMFMFGGRDAEGLPVSRAIRIKRERDDYKSDYSFPWTQLTQVGFDPGVVPDARAGAAAVGVGNGDLLLIGGSRSGSPTGEVWRGRILGKQIRWKKLTPTPIGSDQLPAVHGLNAFYSANVNRVFVFGGSNAIGSGEAASNGDVYSLLVSDTTLGSTQCDVTLATVDYGTSPGPRSYASLSYDAAAHLGMPTGVAGNKYARAFLFGGRKSTNDLDDHLHALWVKDATHVVWEPLEPPTGAARPSARAHHGAAVDGRSEWLVVSGGTTSAGTSSNEVWAYDVRCPGQPDDCSLVAKHWEPLPHMLLGVRNHCIADLGPEPAFSRVPEIFDPSKPSGQVPQQQWTALSGSPHWQEWYSFGFVGPRRTSDPAGHDSLRVFYAGPEIGSPTLNLTTNPPRWIQNPAAPADTFKAGAAVMYKPGKVMKAGTRDTGPFAALGATATMDLKAGTNWVGAARADEMIGRKNHNLVLLPTGEVIVVGGGHDGSNEHPHPETNDIKMPQIWNPDTLEAGHWYGQDGMKFDSSSVRRFYHTTAILLPDARILVAGGAFDDPIQRRADIYSPYYLFNADNTPRTRPVIVNPLPPVRVSYGERFALYMGATSNDIVSKLSLIRPGATTHGFDQNQRFVPLSFAEYGSTPTGDRRYLVSAPADSMDAPPGDYMLFALNAAGTPAIARWIQVRATNLDTDPPIAVANLHKVCGHGDWVELEWTPPSGNQATGSCPCPAALYDIRWKESPIATDADFNAIDSNHRNAGPPPADPYPGYPQSTAIFGLTLNHTYYFRLKSKDYAYGEANWSAMSNQLAFVLHDETCGGSGGGGGCCHEEGMTSPRGGGAYWLRRPGGTGSDPSFLENTLLPNTPVNVASTDLIRLPYGPKWTASGSRIRLSQAGALATRFDHVRLVGVAIAPGEDAFVAGDQLVSGTLTDPVRITHADGRDLTALFAADSSFDGREGDTLYVEFAESTPARIAIQASRSQLVLAPDRTGIDLQCETAQGWASVAHHDPRELASDALYDARSPGRLRLVFLGEHRLHGVARFVPGSTPTVTAYEPTSVVHSRYGDMTATLGSIGAVLAAGESMLADFAVTKEQSAGLGWFLEVSGEHVAGSNSGGAAIRQAPGADQPLRFALSQNRPNPFGTETQVGFELPVRSRVKLEVFDLLGRRVATLANAAYEPGRYSVSWNRRGSGGARVPAGVYTYRLTTGQHQEQLRMIVFP